MEFFKIQNYRKLIRWSLQRLKSRGETVTYSELAVAAQIQGPYLSKVLSGDADLNDDQAFLLIRRLKLSNEETEYFNLLLHFDKAQVQQRKEILQVEINRIRAIKVAPDAQRHAERLHTGRVGGDRQIGNAESSEALARYYLNPLMQIVHMHLTISKWRANPEQLLEKLQIHKEQLSEILSTLEALNIIELKQGRYQLVKEQLHLSRTSPLCEPQQALMKMASIDRCRKVPGHRRYSFVATFSANEVARNAIVDAYAAFLGELEVIVKAAPSEEVYQIHFDLFPWS